MWNKLTGFARRNKAEGSESRLREPRTGNTTIAIETAREVLTARRLERTFCAELLGVSSFINSVNPLERRVMKRVDRVSGKGADIAALVPRVPKAVPGLMQSFSDETRSGEQLAAEIGPVPGLPDDIADRAVGLLLEAARRSMDVGAFNQVRRQTTRALDLAPSDAAIASELLLLRAQAQTERRQLAPALADADDALEAAVAAGDRRQEGLARRLRGVLHQRDGDLAGARRELGSSVDIFRELGDDTELAASLRERGLAEVFGGSLSDAEWLLGEAEGLLLVSCAGEETYLENDVDRINRIMADFLRAVRERDEAAVLHPEYGDGPADHHNGPVLLREEGEARSRIPPKSSTSRLLPGRSRLLHRRELQRLAGIARIRLR